MMHGREKPDLVVVAVKPTNKAEQSAAELVEPRTGPRETRDSKARPGQDLVSASQALSRVRKATKQKKKEKFTTFFCSRGVGRNPIIKRHPL
jgi:hypothetical protein